MALLNRDQLSLEEQAALDTITVRNSSPEFDGEAARQHMIDCREQFNEEAMRLLGNVDSSVGR